MLGGDQNPMNFGAQPVDSTAANAATSAASGAMGMNFLRFNLPKVFDGKDDQFELWSYKLRAYMALANPMFRDMMRQAQEATESIDFDLFETHEKVLAAQV